MRYDADDSYFDVSIDLRLGEEWGYGTNGAPGVFGDLRDFVVRLLGHPEDLRLEETDYAPYLEEKPGDFSKFKITDVYLFDHGTNTSIEIGDETLSKGTYALSTWLADVKAALATTGPTATFHFRGCHIGETDARGHRSFLADLATGMGHKVTAVDGTSSINLLTLLLGGKPGGPDYTFSKGLYLAHPGAGVRGVTPVWKNEWSWKYLPSVDKFAPYNPWGPQPY